MSLNEFSDISPPTLPRGLPCVLVAAAAIDGRLRECLDSLLANTSAEVPVAIACSGPRDQLVELLEQFTLDGRSVWLASNERGTGKVGSRSGGSEGAAGQRAEEDSVDGERLAVTVERAIGALGVADVALLSEPCVVMPGWLGRLRAAAYADSTTATASALADAGTALAVAEAGLSHERVLALMSNVAEHSLQLRPRLNVVLGPCVYLRRDALELVGPIDSTLALRWALEIDFAQRCLLSGLAHVAADDVLVGARSTARSSDLLPERLHERYPHISEPPAVAASGVLPRALEAARRPREHLSVTIDCRALTSTLTGTQRHILELVRALAATGRLKLRLLVSADTSEQNVALLRSLEQTEVLAVEQIEEGTPRSTIFHRPQQVFGPPDLRLAMRLGERIVLNQLDLIAYRNPSYHRDATAWHSHRRASRQALAVADRVLVFSEHTRSELLGDELVDDDRVRVVPPGLDHPPSAEGSAPAALAPAAHPPAGAESPGASNRAGAREQDVDGEGFLLCLGTDFRHKNRVFAMRLLAELRERHNWRGRLVLAGTHVPDGSSQELEHEYLRAQPQLSPYVLDLGAVEEPQKRWLMRNCAAVLYPSVYEGFGLVPFEAGASGVPCLFAAQSSLAEVLPGQAATIVPWSVSESAQQALALLRDGEQRARHVERLAGEAQKLTWSAAAAATLELYEEAAVAPVREAIAMARDEVEREQTLRELIADQDAHVAQLVGEREHAREMYDALNAEVGTGLSLIGPRGALPQELQHGLLALSARPALSRPLFGLGAGLFRAARVLGRRVRSVGRTPG
jgi:glycosyltransferase involved in cell wall biosynthesis